MRPMHRRATAFTAIALAVLPASCHPKNATKIVVGVQSEPMGGIVTALHIAVRIAGRVVDDEVVKPPRGSLVGFPQPWEKTFDAPSSSETSAKVDVQVDAIGDPHLPDPLLTRLSSTHFVPQQTRLLRVPLESRCVVYPKAPRLNEKIPGPLSGPTCTAPATCISGVCQRPDVPPMLLEPYAPNWPTNAPDRCKVQGGKPDLQVGTGQSYYLPMAKDQVLQAEAGPQGGHHIWIATRMKNLKQAGSITKITGISPETGVAIPPTALAFTYSPDEGGYCKLYGIRYQLDNEGIDYKQFLGKPLDLVVTVTDSAGASATAKTRVQIAPGIRNP